MKQSYRDFLRLAPDLWANVRWVTRGNLQASCREVIEQMGYPGASFKVIGFGGSASGRTSAGEAANVEGSTPEGPGRSRDVHKGTDSGRRAGSQVESTLRRVLQCHGSRPCDRLVEGTGGVEDRFLPPCRNQVRLRPGGKPRPRLRSERRVRHESRRNLDDPRMAGRAGASGRRFGPVSTLT